MVLQGLLVVRDGVAGVGERGEWLPSGFPVRVPAPLDEVTRACTCPALGDDAFHLEHRCSILECHLGWRPRVCGGASRKSSVPVAILFESADVEHRVNLKLRRKVEFVGIIVDDAFDCEWSEVFEGKFGSSLVGAEHLEVLRGQQHLVADCKGNCAAVLIGVVRLALLSFLDVRARVSEVRLQATNA